MQGGGEKQKTAVQLVKQQVKCCCCCCGCVDVVADLQQQLTGKLIEKLTDRLL